MKITINAGHCPNLDSGAVGQTGLQEQEVARDISNKVIYYLNDVGYQCLFVQKNELFDIAQTSNDFNADLFISIHCNSAGNRTAKGTETFAINATGEGNRLAECIQSQIVKSMNTVDRGVKYANFQVLRQTNCPAVLIEVGFISNEEEEMLLASEEGKDNFAKCIARGITDYAV